jgi:hypothetical protein
MLYFIRISAILKTSKKIDLQLGKSSLSNAETSPAPMKRPMLNRRKSVIERKEALRTALTKNRASSFG